MVNELRRKIFVGSTSKDLQPQRDRVREIIESLGFESIMMKEFEASDLDPVSLSLQKVDEADYYVGIYANRYGWIPESDTNPSRISITEMEFNRAEERGIPCFIFVLDKNAIWHQGSTHNEDGGGKLQEFKRRLTEQKKHTVKFFDHDVENLAKAVKDSLLKHIDRYLLPYAVIAMTHEEFEELWQCSEDWFYNKCNGRPKDLEKLRNLLKELEAQGLTHEILAKAYCERRKEWTPVSSAADAQFGKPVSSAEEIIRQIFERFNSQLTHHSNVFSILPQDYSDELLSDDQHRRFRANQELQENAGIFVVDSISLFHPLLHQYFGQVISGMKENTPIIFVLPFGVAAQPVNQLLSQHIENTIGIISYRFTEKMDHLCELNASDQIQIKRWLQAILPNVSDSILRRRPVQAQIEAARRQAQEQGLKSTSGISNLI